MICSMRLFNVVWSSSDLYFFNCYFICTSADFIICPFSLLHSSEKKLLQGFYKVFVGAKTNVVGPALFHF